jgi:hypothetical protein
VAAQLGIHDVACLADYAARPATAWEHAAEIRRQYGYRDFTDPAESFRLMRWLYTRAGRLKLLARYASSARAQAIQRMPAERGIATLVAFACALQASAQDDVLDVLGRLLSDLLARVGAQEKRRRFRTIGDLDRAALLLRDIGLLVLDHTQPDHLLRGEIFKRVPRERIEQAIATVGELARAPENDLAPEALLSRNEHGARADDLPISVCAVLLARPATSASSRWCARTSQP